MTLTPLSKKRLAARIANHEARITALSARHDHRYDYSRVPPGFLKKGRIEVVCPRHGAFYPSAISHGRKSKGTGCPRCSHITTSTPEREMLDFVRSIAPDPIHQHSLGGVELDIHCPRQGRAFEHNGLFWHSSKVGKSRVYHQQKIDHAAKHGIHLIQSRGLEPVETRHRSRGLIPIQARHTLA